jgi:hypothetical protein
MLTISACGNSSEEQGTKSEPKPKTKVAILFCDVTNSLLKDENKEVGLIATAVLNNLPVGTKYVIYPIQMETQRLNPIKEGRVLEPDSDPDVQKAFLERTNKEVIEQIDELYRTTNTPRPANAPKLDNRTCILNSLNFAENYFRQYDLKTHETELIFISDMIEECDSTPLQARIELDKQDISKEIGLAEKFPPGLNLSHTRITIIIPSTKETYSNAQPGRRPSIEQLKAFWYRIFKNCGLQDSALQNQAQYYWHIGGVPERFKKIEGD